MLLGERVAAEPVLELAALDDDRDLGREQAQPAGVVVVQVRQVDARDVRERDAVLGERVGQRLAVARRAGSR